LRVVVSVATRYLPSGEPLDELVAEGNLAMMRALHRFDPERGLSFGTYARYWVRAYLTRYVRRTRSMVSTASHADGLLNARISEARRRLAGSSEGVSSERLAQLVGTTPDVVRRVESRVVARDVSLDVPILPDGGPLRRDTLAAPDRDPETQALHDELKGILRNVIKHAELDARERTLVEARLLAPAGAVPTLAELGRRLGVSREWARRLEGRALAKVENALRLAMFRPREPVEGH
jgi:RNA polymerase sigma-32 factor